MVYQDITSTFPHLPWLARFDMFCVYTRRNGMCTTHSRKVFPVAAAAVDPSSFLSMSTWSGGGSRWIFLKNFLLEAVVKDTQDLARDIVLFHRTTLVWGILKFVDKAEWKCHVNGVRLLSTRRNAWRWNVVMKCIGWIFKQQIPQ